MMALDIRSEAGRTGTFPRGVTTTHAASRLSWVGAAGSKY